MIKFRHLFHGTSSVYKASIQEAGLLPQSRPIFLTTHPLVALMEAHRTVDGEENLLQGYKKRVGGSPIVVIVERAAATKLSLDAEYYYQEDRPGYRRPELRYSFATNEGISPASLSFLETGLFYQCKELLDEINWMTNRPALQGVTVDFKSRRVYST
jgi:hypothetical protein